MLIVSALLEVLLYYTPLWRWRKPLAIFIILMLVADTILLGYLFPLAVGLTYGIANFVRAVHLARLIKGRSHEARLHRVVKRTGFSLVLTQIVLTEFMTAWTLLSAVRMAVAVSQLVIAVIMLLTTIRTLYKTRQIASKDFYTDKELPTVSVAIPARNETQALTSCLTSVVANTYPKLEILVLDDCSQDKTSEIIKGFAKDGVRFLKGEAPDEQSWLAKNQAYHQLADAATGEYILFMGADVRLGPDTIRALVSTALSKQKVMVSVLPLRVGTGLGTSLLQPLRYWWEVALPRRWFNRPSTLGSCWIIQRQALLDLGSFEAVSRSVLPEAYFARELVKADGYSFTRANAELEVRTTKSAADLFKTAVRTRYPQLRKRMENSFLLVVAEAVLLFLPFASVVYGLFNGFGGLEALSAVSAVLLVLTQIIITSVTDPGNTFIALVNLPFAVITEAAITVLSTFRYEFGTVAWRDRNICIAVMHVYPGLPLFRL